MTAFEPGFSLDEGSDRSTKLLHSHCPYLAANVMLFIDELLEKESGNCLKTIVQFLLADKSTLPNTEYHKFEN